MMNRTARNRAFRGALAGAVAGLLAAWGAAADPGDANGDSRVQAGYALTPVPLDLAGKNRALVGLGSYLVNSSGCNDCHTHPSFAKGGDPYKGQPEQINTDQFLSGGRTFGPFMSANLTPDANGLPAGLTLAQFIQTLRTGHNPLDPPGAILQVMPWPAFGKKTDQDLAAIYEYLRAIPPLPNNPTPGP